MKKTLGLLMLLVLFSGLIFRASFTNYFYQDDFFHMALTNSQNLVDSFNIFKPAHQDFFIYRPLSTQLFWNIGQTLFHLNVLGYHLVTFAFFAINIFLVYLFSRQFLKNSKLAWVTTVIYALSPTHYYRLFFLSQFQEILMATFILLAMVFFLKKNWLFLPMFLLALLCKETAIMLPVILLFLNIFEGKFYFKKILAAGLLAVGYFVCHKYFFGFFVGGAYAYDLNVFRTVNNYLWYLLWSFGVPETFANLKLIVFPTLVNPKFFTDFGTWGIKVISLIIFQMGLICIAIVRSIKKKDYLGKDALFGLIIFLTFILPVGFFPFHKFGYSLTLPVLGLSFFLAKVFSGTRLVAVYLTVYIISTYTLVSFNDQYHWASKNARLAENVLTYFKKNYPALLPTPNIYFRNKNNLVCMVNSTGVNWTEQLSYALSDARGLQIFYNNPNVQVYYEDLDKDRHLMPNSLMVYSEPFFKVN